MLGEKLYDITGQVTGTRVLPGAGPNDVQLEVSFAGTGKILAESDFLEPLSINGLTPPGFGGRIYFPTAVGKGFYVLQVLPKPAPPSSK